jgi:hypothetical protein
MNFFIRSPFLEKILTGQRPIFRKKGRNRALRVKDHFDRLGAQRPTFPSFPPFSRKATVALSDRMESIMVLLFAQTFFSQYLSPPARGEHSRHVASPTHRWIGQVTGLPPSAAPL